MPYVVSYESDIPGKESQTIAGEYEDLSFEEASSLSAQLSGEDFRECNDDEEPGGHYSVQPRWW